LTTDVTEFTDNKPLTAVFIREFRAIRGENPFQLYVTTEKMP
jgi:hypothetical protein